MWRRILRIPFEHTVPEEDRNPKIKKVLTDPKLAGPAILAWMMEGYRIWQEAGKLLVPEAVKMSTEAYRLEVDPLSNFVQDRCLIDPENPEYWESFAELWENYQKWCDENKVRFPIKKGTFSKRLRNFGLEPKQAPGGSARGWQGVRLTSENQ